MLDARSVLWRYAGDWRYTLFLGRAFLLQAAHPTVAAGVAEHSMFERDPWGRLLLSYGRVLRTIYGPDGEQVGADVRVAHRRIRGVTADGRRYRAYEPEAYFWVVATGAETVVEMASRIGRALSGAELDRLYEETRELGRRFGLRDQDMPVDRSAFEAWYREILTERIEYTDTVRRVLEVFSRPGPPRQMPGALWAPLGRASGHLVTLLTVGTLPNEARDRLGLSLGAAQHRELTAVCAALRVANAAPPRLRYLPAARAAYAHAV
jgi:uncharacterized protein (DUF2236 family)